MAGSAAYYGEMSLLELSLAFTWHDDRARALEFADASYALYRQQRDKMAFSDPSIHDVVKIEASGIPADGMAYMRLDFTQTRHDPHYPSLTVFFPVELAGYAKRLIEAINAVPVADPEQYDPPHPPHVDDDDMEI